MSSQDGDRAPRTRLVFDLDPYISCSRKLIACSVAWNAAPLSYDMRFTAAAWNRNEMNDI